MKKVLDEIDPNHYYFEEVKSRFFHTEYWPKAFAFGYDWLYPLMIEKERNEIVDKLELWCKALYEHTVEHWWQDASLNCGAIPAGAVGLLCVAIQDKADHPEFEKWLKIALNGIQENYYPTTWRQNGICYEGLGYTHYHKNPTMFGEALRLTGGTDIIKRSGAINAMQYLRFQWLSHGGCAPIGDNTNYDKRVFQSIYLFGIGEQRDKAGFYTFLKCTKRERLNPILAFIFYPLELKPIYAGKQDHRTSYSFEITPHSAGYLFSRSEWNNEEAAFFSYVTRDELANHQHYDMNSFLFSAFGEEFATHPNLYPCNDSLYGVDKENNLVIVDGGGMPSHDAIDGAGDDCSLNGYLTGVIVTCHFADYVPGDAAKSYKDRSLEESKPAVRADRYGAFVKQGPNPYLVMVDDIRKSRKVTHTYDWLWYSEAMKLAGGQSTLSDPLVISGGNTKCAVGFVTPKDPQYKFKVATGGHGNHLKKLGLTKVRQQGNRVNYFAVGAVWKNDKARPKFQKGSQPTGSEHAKSLVIKGKEFTDYVVCQPEEVHGEKGKKFSCGDIVTDGFLTVVRTNSNGKITGYLLDDSTELTYKDKILAESLQMWSISADAKRLFTKGKRLARASMPSLPPKGKAWLSDKDTEVWFDGKKVIETKLASKRMAVINE